MSKIFELYGYRLNHWSEEAENNLRCAWCPFMNAECDGGGNRYQSAIDLSKHPELREKFPNKDIIQVGICSLQTRENEQPWIVCPRRLLSLKGGNLSSYQTHLRKQLSLYSQLDETKKYLAWGEVKIKAESTTEDDEAKSFDYTFDYVLSGIRRIRLQEASELLEMPESVVQKLVQKSGFTLSYRDSEYWIDNFPSDPLIIIEVMTSSTSGGDKKKRTQIAMACEDAILNGAKHNGPGINYRQVWARMVSQLIVKSQVGIAWGGKTIWLVQDVLADYISKSTALILPKYLAESLNEVNILAYGYGEKINQSDGKIIELDNAKLYSGPITEGGSSSSHDGFVDIVKIGAPPPKKQIWKSLISKAPIGYWEI
ncbi:MAG: hypothetical protein FWH17_04720 [Oscillospiraceae bacterium]|nr:hypothetical protein [Oscillospiraceae bacterium]